MKIKTDKEIVVSNEARRRIKLRTMKEVSVKDEIKEKNDKKKRKRRRKTMRKCEKLQKLVLEKR